MTLSKEKYNSEINLYYKNILPCELADSIVRHIWYNQDSAGEFELVRNIRAKVYKMKFQDEIYYLKWYVAQHTSKILKNFFRPADAVRYFTIADKLAQAGIAIAPPVLAITRKTGLRPAESIFVTREVPGDDLYEYLIAGAQHDPQQREQIVSQFAFMWSKLIRLNLVHLDPWLGNFIVHPGQAPGDIQIELIDVDNIYPRPLLPRKLLWLLNVKRLNYKLERVKFPVTQAETELFLTELDKFLK